MAARFETALCSSLGPLYAYIANCLSLIAALPQHHSESRAYEAAIYLSPRSRIFQLKCVRVYRRRSPQILPWLGSSSYDLDAYYYGC